MVLATTEFSFNLEFLAGKKNVLADYGTRQIPDTDWPVQEDDPLELNNLLPFNSFEVIQFPNIEKRFYSSDDFLEATNLDLNPKEHEVSCNHSKQAKNTGPYIYAQSFLLGCTYSVT